MKKYKFTPPELYQNEKGAGLVYLVFSLAILPSLLTLEGYLPGLLGNAGVNLVYNALNFVMLVFLLRRFLRHSVEYAGKHLWPIIGYILLGFFLYFSTNLTLSYLLDKLLPGYANQNDAAIQAQLREHFWLTAIGTVFLVPLSEELLHRAVVFGCLREKNVVLAYIFSMFIFSAVHVVGYIGAVSPTTLLVSFLQYLPAGFVLAWTYQRSSCIFVPILIHTAINALGVMAMR